MDRISGLLNNKKRVVICIDGRSAAGKTTLSDELAAKYGGTVIRMDYFFPPKDTEKKNEINIEISRFQEEIIKGIISEKEFTYKIFDCKIQDFVKSVTVSEKRLLIVEGAYSMHPLFESIYDLKIFVDVSFEEQKRRIMARDGKEKYSLFINEWIPAEEKYLKTYSIEKKSDVIYRNELKSFKK